MITTRPKTLAEVGRYVLEGNAMAHELADFLDEFYESPNEEAFAEEPPILASRIERGQKHDSFLAATAEYLAMKYGFSAPDWAFDPARSLDDPVFDFKSRAGRLFLLKDSPAAFKSRNLFVTGAVLDRV